VARYRVPYNRRGGAAANRTRDTHHA
jgi:hypothetical protein